ncbi:hypothetical protein J23TS9_30830 [Paenibacillus sp. J23TS9]|uniref:hypothetical protein n=1 Tax=Paenibacillus sp. J23TS9 TaxID=2807193 RepID=UPI001B1D140F|nr:hypothetical protein [Paenibacillus sp. J23TS9]GIP27953.1 hypothetical protein J23TS9_30830 [Paenibacillus sp. J23TS9]
MQSSTQPSAPYQNRTKREKSPSVKLVLLIWILLIAAGITAAYLYSNHVKHEMLQQLQADSHKQMNELKMSYEAKFEALSGEVKELESKVQSFNELLTFTKDNATSKTDNSNKLYTQLNEVKKQLNTLQQKMDLLK